MQPLCQFRFPPSSTRLKQTNKKQKTPNIYSITKEERNEIRRGCDTHAQWRVCTFLSGKWWRLSRSLKSLCSLWMEVAVKTNNTCGEKLFALEVRHLSRALDIFRRWKKASGHGLRLNWCNIQVWKSHVAYRDPDHTHTHWPSAFKASTHTHQPEEEEWSRK